MKLTPKQLRFVNKYVGPDNIKESAKYAGFTYDYARKLVTKQHIKDAIRQKQAKIQKKLEIDQEWLLKRYKKLTDYSILDFFEDDGTMKPLSEIPESVIYAICGLEVETKSLFQGRGKKRIHLGDSQIRKFKLPDKKGTLDSIAKLLGLVVDKSQVDVGEKLEDVLRNIHKKRKNV